MIIRPSFTVLSGAAIGLVAGAAVYGAVSTASAATSTSVKPAKASVAAPAAAARCAAGQKLEDGVCIVHVEKTVVVAAPPAAAAESGALGAVVGADHSAGPSSSDDHGTEVGEDVEDATSAAEDATEHATEGAEDATEHATEGAEHATDDGGSDLSGPEQGAYAAGSDDDSSDAPRG